MSTVKNAESYMRVPLVKTDSFLMKLSYRRDPKNAEEIIQKASNNKKKMKVGNRWTARNVI